MEALVQLQEQDAMEMRADRLRELLTMVKVEQHPRVVRWVRARRAISQVQEGYIQAEMLQIMLAQVVVDIMAVVVEMLTLVVAPLAEVVAARLLHRI
jgi:hypothetical protein